MLSNSFLHGFLAGARSPSHSEQFPEAKSVILVIPEVLTANGTW
jgi:hypothetical protein